MHQKIIIALLTISSCSFINSSLIAQVYLVNNNAKIQINNGIDLRVSNGSVINQNSGQINNDGDLYLGRDFSQNTAAAYTGGGASWLWFEGTSNQNISSDATLDIARLKVDNGNRLLLNNNVNVSTTVDLSNNGSIELGTSNLVVAPGGIINNYDASNYIVSNSIGYLQQEVGNTNVLFPVGNSSYNPATLNNIGTVDNFQIRVLDQVLQEGTTGAIMTTDAVNRTWMIDEQISGGSDVSMTLQWNTIDELTAFDRTACGIAHHLNATLWDNPPAYLAANNVATNTWTRSRSGFSSFSPFVVRDVDIYLPVELLSFEANRLTADEVQLSWATASETNNKGFYIERMLENETEFSTVAWQDGNGTTTNTSYYGINDPNAYSGISYYRLKQVDTDESFNYSVIRAVAGQEGTLASFTNLNIYPNPVENYLKIRFGALPKQSNEAQIKIIAIDGRILYEFTATIEAHQVLEIDYVKNLIPAMYLLSIDMEGKQRVMEKFVKKE